MKIKTLRFKNINSLKGIFKIDFDSPPLQHSGIFAITGPTGSGKTTILDAVCAALYSRTPRLPSGNCVELMTRHTGDCFAEVDFTINKGVFRSRWAVRRARGKAGGNLQPATMELSRLKGDLGTIIEDKKSKVPAGIEKLTGLDFSRFTRSILLAQGGFAAFLSASENERADLLEKMTGTRIYTLISTTVFERNKMENQTLEKLTIAADTMDLLSDDEYKALVQKKQELSERAGESAKQLSDVEKKINWVKTRLQLDKSIEDLREKSVEDVKSYSLRRNDIQQLQLAEKSMPLTGDFEVLKKMRADGKDCENQIAVLKNRIPEIEKKRSWFEMERISLSSEFEAFLMDLEQKEKKIIQAEKLDERIHGEKTKYTEKSTAVRRLEENKKDLEKKKKSGSEKILQLLKDKQALTAYKKNHENDVRLEADLDIIDQYLKDHALKTSDAEKIRINIEQNKKEREKFEKELADSESVVADIERNLEKETDVKNSLEKKAGLLEEYMTLEQWESEEKSLQVQKAALEQEITLDREIENHKKNCDFVEKQRLENKQAMETADINFDDHRLLIEKEKAILEQLEELSRLELMVVKYESDRKTLVEGSPCPLCGSRQHPWKAKDSRIESKADVALRHQKRKIYDIEKETALFFEEKGKLEKTDARLMEKEKTISGAIDDFCRQRDELASPYKTDGASEKEQTPKEMLEGVQALYQDATAQIKSIRETKKALLDAADRLLKIKENHNRLLIELEEARSRLRRLKDSAKQYEKENDAIDKESDKIQQRLDAMAAKYGEKPVKAVDWHHLEKHLEKRFHAFVTTAADLEQFEKQYLDENQNLGIVRTKLEACAKRLEQEKILGDIIKAEKDRMEYKRFEVLKEKDIESLRASLKKARAEKEKKLRDTEKQAAGLESDLVADKRLFDAKTKELAALSDRIRKAEKRFQKNMEKVGFDTVTAFEASLMEEMKRQEIAAFKAKMTRQLAGTKAKLKDALLKVDQMKKQPETSHGLDTLFEKQRQLKETLVALNQELGAVDDQITRQEQLNIKYTDQLDKIKHQKKECRRWERLNSLIGSATGVLFQRFAQGLTLDHLLAVANQYLSVLNNRYYLKRKENEELGLVIVDKWQADVIRPTDTLSGGETFLVSLALALGLSALAGPDTSIDSLFLDEGFGTLDPDTLEVALAALDTLNATGKTIGIISHVEALKERISTQIQVVPVSGGISTIKIV